jgi:hypothetical protein
VGKGPGRRGCALDWEAGMNVLPAITSPSRRVEMPRLLKTFKSPLLSTGKNAYFYNDVCYY